MAKILTLEQRTRTLNGTFARLMPKFEQVHHISKLQSERLTDKVLRDQWFYTGDGVVYGLRDNDVMLYLTDFPNNPLMKHLQIGVQSLMRCGYFFVNPTDAKDLEAKAASSSGVVAFNLSRMHLQRFNNRSCYIEVPTAKLAEGREAFKQEYGEEVTALFDRVHGNAIYGENGIGALLQKEDEKTTRISVLAPGHVKWIDSMIKTLKENGNGTMIAQISFLHPIYSRSDVSLIDSNVDLPYYVRGVVKP